MEIKAHKGKEYLQVPMEIKQGDVGDDGMFTGMASTFGNMDSYRDIVAQGAFSKTLSKGGRNGTGIAMLWAHNSDQPLGVWRELEETKKGLKVTGQIAVETQLGHDKHVLMKMGAIKGLSIGFNSMVEEYDRTKKIRVLKEVELWEISPVTFPANVKAQVTDVKAIQEAKTERELEHALRDAGLKHHDARYVIELIKKGTLRDAGPVDEGDETMHTILAALKKANNAFKN